MAKVPAEAASTTPSVDDGFVEEVVFYFVVKFLTSLDDLIWLSPFVAIAQSATAHATLHVCLVYAAICLLVSLEALAFSAGAERGLAVLVSDPDEASQILNVVGGLCIAVFAYVEWRSGGDDDVEDEEDGIDDSELDKEVKNEGEYGSLGNTTMTPSLLEEGAMQSANVETKGLLESNHHNEEELDQSSACRRHQRHVLIDLFVVGICGTLDTLAVFFSVLMSQNPSRRIILPVLIGSTAAAAVILVLAYSITLCRPLTRCLQRVPLWLLLCLIAVYILLSGLLGW